MLSNVCRLGRLFIKGESMLFVLMFVSALFVGVLVWALSAQSSLGDRNETIASLVGEKKELLQEVERLSSLVEESQRIIDNADTIISTAQEKAEKIVTKASIESTKIREKARDEANEIKRNARSYSDKVRLDELLEKNQTPKEKKTRKQQTNEVFDQMFEDKKIPSEYLKPKVDVEFINNPLARRKVVITGELSKTFRSDMAEDLWLLGADVDTSLSAMTNVLVVGENPGYKKMEQLEVFTQIETFTEDEIAKLLRMSDGWEAETDKLVGMTFFVAGKFKHFVPTNLKLLIMDNGGRVASRIGKKVNYILLGEDPDYKVIEEAEKWKINYLSENNLLTILGIKESVREYL